MSDGIIVALIAASASIIGQLIISKTSAKKDGYERAKRQQKLDDDIATLTKRVNEHNNYAAMFAAHTDALTQLSTNVQLLQKDIEYLKKGLFKDGTAN